MQYINAVTSSGDVLELLVGFDNAEVILLGLDLQFLLLNSVRGYIVESHTHMFAYVPRPTNSEGGGREREQSMGRKL